MQNESDQDMRQPNSFQEQGENNASSVPSKEDNTSQPNSFQEQPPHIEKNHTQKQKKTKSTR